MAKSLRILLILIILGNDIVNLLFNNTTKNTTARAAPKIFAYFRVGGNYVATPQNSKKLGELAIKEHKNK